jgi:threonine/homoserine/homoserine lactone efflux protein
MLGTQDLTLFIVSGLLLNAVPGSDTLLVVSRGAAHGFRIGSAAALGVGAGVFVHVLAAALGLSALLATSATAFTAIKWVGAAYLVYLGLQMLFSGKPRSGAEADGTQAGAAAGSVTWRSVFLQGFVTNVLNPKVALFFLAFVPQFIAADAPSTALAFLFLGTLFNINSIAWSHGLAWMAATGGQRIRLPGSAALWLTRGVGVLFVGFGVRLALFQR